MYSAVSTASYVVGEWQKQVPCFRFLRGFWKASYWQHVRKNVMSSLHTKSAIDLTKTPFQLHDILSYTESEITFIRQAPTGDWNIFMVTRWKMWSPNSVKKFFLHGKTQKRKVFKTIFCMKIFLLRNDRKNQILCVKALKCHVLEMVFSSNR